MDRRYIGIKELAEYIGITRGTLYVWVCQRKIPYSKVGKLLKFDIREIDEWVKKARVEPFN